MNDFRAQASPGPAPNALTQGLLAAGVIVLLGYMTVTSPLPRHAVADARPALPAPAVPAPCVMDQPGMLRGRVFGSLSLTMDWQGPELACDGSSRPGDTGLRLFFTGRAEGSPAAVVVVLGIDGGVASLKGSERPVAITLNDEASHRFFHAEAGRCFTRVSEVTALPGTPGRLFRINGVAWCVGALPSVSDDASITLGDLRYSGRLSLDDG